MAEQNAGPGDYLGFMQKGSHKNSIRDHQVADLAQVREQAMAKEAVSHVSKIIEDQLRGLADPRQMSVALREPIALKEHRLDAYDKPLNVQTFQLNDSSSDSGGSEKSDTHPEVCWEVLEWIGQTDSLVGTSPRTRYDKSVQWIIR